MDVFGRARAAIDGLRKPTCREISTGGSLIAEQIQLESYNPDSLVGKKGIGIYRKMGRDDAVKAGMSVKKLIRLSTSWDIEPASQDDADKKIAEFVKLAFSDYLPGTFRTNIKQMLSCLDYGFSVTEKTMRFLETGEWRGKYVLKSLKTRLPDDLGFKVDEFGNLQHITQETEGGVPRDMPPDKFIVATNDKQFDNWYGNSDLRAAYRHWLTKDWFLKFQAVGLERFGMGVTKASYPRNFVNEKGKLEEILTAIQAKTHVVVPDDVKIELMEMQGRGMDAFEQAIQGRNTSIMRSILVPDLLGFTDKEGGAFALGKKHFDIFMAVIMELGEQISEAWIGEQLITPLVDVNFPNVTKYPKFVFALLTEDDKFEIARIWNDGVQKGSITKSIEGENHVRGLVGLPEIEDVAPVSEPMTRRTSIASMSKGAKYIKKVDFTKIKRQWDDLEANSTKALGAIVVKQRDKLLKDVEKRKVLTTGGVKEVELLQMGFGGEFRDTVFNMMGTGYLNAKYETMQELRRAGMAAKFMSDKPVPPKEALAYLEGLPVSLQKELAFFKREAFNIAGIESNDLLLKAKAILYRGIRNQTPKQTKRDLKRLFDKYLETTDAATGKLTAAYRLENIVRTNTADAINQGRRAMMEEKEVADDIVAYLFSAVLDDSTTDFCADNNGEMFDKDTFIWGPYHYQCRSIGVAVTRWEIAGEQISGGVAFPAADMPGY